VSEHAKLSPSSADAWGTCEGYLDAIKGLPDDESTFNWEGTVAHSISDMCLTLGMTAYDFIGQKTVHPVHKWSFVWSEEDAELLQPGIDWCNEQPGTFYSERKVSTSRFVGVPGQFGTLDRGIVCDEWIKISDLKWGRGVPVTAKNNKQLAYYALGFWWDVARHVTTTKKVLIYIDQPRNSAGGGFWETSIPELLALVEPLKRAAKINIEGGGKRIASEKGCFWCPAKKQSNGGCHAYDKMMFDLIGQEFDDLDDDEDIILPQNLTPERRSKIVNSIPLIKAWLKDLHGATIHDALGNKPVGNLKVILAPHGRKGWTNVGVAEMRLEEMIGEKTFTKKLISPTQASKLISSEDFKKQLGHLIKERSLKPVLVDADDPRPKASHADEFDDLPDDDDF
jgi:hypothetical protein